MRGICCWLGNILLLNSSLLFAQEKSTTATTTVVPTTPSVGTLLWQISSGLAVVLLIIILLAWLSKRFLPPLGSSLRRNQSLRLVHALSVGTRERVITLEIDNTWLVVGVTPHTISLLHTLPKPENAPSLPANDLPDAFTARLQHFLQQYRRP